MTATFIRQSPNHWKPDDFDLSNVNLAESLLHITKTICLLESRCDDYAEYLQAILRDRSDAWTSAISRWNFEECQHGVTLRAVVDRLRGMPAISELRAAVIWVKGVSSYVPDYYCDLLPSSPWIHQPFEDYDNMRPDALAKKFQV